MGEAWVQRGGWSSSLQGVLTLKGWGGRGVRELLNGLQVSVDGHALAFIEDQQAPTYIHNSVVVNGSEVVVREEEDFFPDKFFLRFNFMARPYG